MSDVTVPKEEKLQEANELLDALMDFAYERGFHECGYNPAKVLNDEITDLRASLRREENAREITARENQRLRDLSKTPGCSPGPKELLHQGHIYIREDIR